MEVIKIPPESVAQAWPHIRADFLKTAKWNDFTEGDALDGLCAGRWELWIGRQAHEYAGFAVVALYGSELHILVAFASIPLDSAWPGFLAYAKERGVRKYKVLSARKGWRRFAKRMGLIERAVLWEGQLPDEPGRSPQVPLDGHSEKHI